MESAKITLGSVKNAQKIAEWSPFSAYVTYGPATSWIKPTAGPGVPTVFDRNDTLNPGVSVQINVLGYLRGIHAAHLNTEAQTFNVENQKLALAGQIDQDWFTLRQQVETDCVERYQIDATLIAFGKLVQAITDGQPYDPVAAAQNFPLALGSLTSLYGSVASAVSALADIRAQIGDLNTPAAWDFQNTSSDFCSGVSAGSNFAPGSSAIGVSGGPKGFGISRHSQLIKKGLSLNN